MDVKRPGRPVDVLLIEDNPGDIRLTEEAFNETSVAVELHAVKNGLEALDYLHRRGDYEGVDRPDLVLLDLNLPGLNGFEVLKEIKTSDELRPVPVIILTSSDSREDISKGYAKHANAYLTKPVDPDNFVDAVRSLNEFWVHQAELPPEDD